jgi:hypothetical protein
MPLSYRDRGTSGTQLDVLSGTVVVCSLRKAMNVDRHARRAMGVDLVNRQRAGRFSIHGSADTKPQAQAVLESMWTAWLAAAGLQENA